MNIVNPIPRIADYSDADYDPYTAALTLGGEGHITDMFPELHRLRHERSIWPIDIREHFGVAPDMTTAGRKNFTVLGFDDVSAVLTDAATFSNKAYATNLGVYFGKSVTVMDEPEHGPYRRLFQKAFLPRSIARWGDRIVPNVINRTIDGFAARGKADLVSEFSLLFPFSFINELMRLPEEDRPIFQKLAFGQIFITFDPEHGMEAVDNLKAYISALIKVRHDHPVDEDDLIHQLANSDVQGAPVPEEIVISFFRQLMTAGGDTSYHGFSNVLTGLLTNPDQLEEVRRDRSLVPHAINEGLRWDAATSTIFRTPTRTVEMGGVTMNPGDIVNVVLAAANRDESQFPDPDRFDIHRKNKDHVAFGRGPHVCIGQHLARMEMTVALNILLDRLPNLRLDPEAPPPVITGLLLRIPDRLPVLFDRP